jgi:hypothetical protein
MFGEIPGMARAQASYDAMEPPYEAECECPELWVCPHCDDAQTTPGTCADDACLESLEDDGDPPASRELVERDHEDARLADDSCKVHGGCQCGDDRCRECG